MNLNEILSNSFHYPLSNVKRMLVLGLLLATSILIVPAVFAYGYFLRIIENSFNGSNELPPFESWGKMFVDGLKYVLVLIIYIGIPAVIASFISIFVLLVMFSRFTDINIFLIVLGTVSIIILALPYILSLIALPNMAYHKMDLSNAFDFKYIVKIINGIGKLRYISAIIVLVIFQIIISGFSFYLQSLHLGLMFYVISGIVSLFIGSYFLSFQGRLLSLLYWEGAKETE